MSKANIEGYSFVGKHEDFDTSLRLEKRFVTVQPIGPNKVGLDVVPTYYSLVGAADRVVGASSTDSVINLTSHGARVGDMIQLKTTANTITQRLIAVKSITSANAFELDGVLDASLTSGDTFDILRPSAARVDSSGSLIVSTSGSAISFTKDGVNTAVTEDTGTPANNEPLPVKLVNTSGDINITAGDLNVQLSHSGGSYDSCRIGDGTDLLAISGSGEASVVDATARTSLSSIDGKLPATLGQKAMTASMAVVVASDQSAVPVSAASLPLPTGAATEATLAAASAKLPAALGAQLVAASLAVNIASNQTVPVSAAALPLPTGAATEATLSTLTAKDFATQTTLAVIAGKDFSTETTLATRASESTLSAASAKLPASLGSKTSANSFSVTMASDQVMPISKGRSAVAKARNDYSSVNVTTSAYTELVASLASEANLMEIFDSSGQTLLVAFGAAASEVEKFYIFPGGNGQIFINIPAATRIAIKAVSATASAGEISVNFYS